MDNNKLYRAFVCVDFPSNVVKEVARIQEILVNWKFNGKMTELENLHLTLKFLGEIDNNKLEKIKRSLSDIKFNKFEARLENVGIFSFHGNPRIVWTKIGGDGIFKLQSEIDRILSEIGFEKEQRFMSHMTIARIKYIKDKIGFREYIKGIKLKDIKFEIDRFKLKESELRGAGPVYSDLENYLLDS